MITDKKIKNMKKEKNGKRLDRMAALLNGILGQIDAWLEEIDSKIGNGSRNLPKYYRNEDLKKMFGLSSNTIVKYRQEGILPFTRLGDIILYDAAKIAKILKDRSDGKGSGA